MRSDERKVLNLMTELELRDAIKNVLESMDDADAFVEINNNVYPSDSDYNHIFERYEFDEAFGDLSPLEVAELVSGSYSYDVNDDYFTKGDYDIQSSDTPQDLVSDMDELAEWVKNEENDCGVEELAKLFAEYKTQKMDGKVYDRLTA